MDSSAPGGSGASVSAVSDRIDPRQLERAERDRRRLTRRILGGAIVVALAIVGVSATMLWRLAQGQLGDGLNDVSALDLLIAAQTERAFDNVGVLLDDISADLQAQSITSPGALRQAAGDEATFRLLRAKMAGVPQVDALAIVNADGDVVNRSRSYPVAPQVNLAQREYFFRLRDHPELKAYISPPRQNSDGKPMIYVGKRLNAPNGAFMGIVLGAIRVDYFHNLYANYLEALPGGDKSVALWRSDGALLARSPDAGDAAAATTMPPDLERPPPRNGLLAYWMDDTQGHSIAVAQRRIDDLPLSIEVRQSASAMLAPWNGEFLATGFGGGALLLLVAAAVWLLLRQVRAQALLIEERARANREAEAREDIELARMKAEAAMRDAQQSEARFRDIAEVGSDWIWETDAEHRFTMVAGARRPMLDLVGKTRWEHVGADPETDPFWREHKALLDAHQPFRNFRFAAAGASGHFDVCVNGKPIFDDDGSFIGYRGTVADETELVEARERALRADTLLRDAIESIAEGFVVYDKDDRLVLWNEAYRKMYPENSDRMFVGSRYEDAMRAAIAAGRYPDAKGHEEEWLAERLRKHREPGAPEETRLSDGRWVLRSERRMSDGSIAGLRIDVTALKAAQESLRESQVMLNRAQKLSGTGSVVRNLKSGALEWSEELYRIFGVDPENFVPSSDEFHARIHPEDREKVLSAREAGLTGQSVDPMEFRILRADGTIRWVYREVELVRDSTGEPTSLLSTYQDITDKRTAEDQRRALEVLLRDAIESIPEGFVIYDADDRLVLCNEAFRNLYPKSTERMVPGVRYEDILRGAVFEHGAVPRERAEEWLARRLREHRELNGPVELQLDDGRWLLISERRTSSGGTAGLRVNITALKKTQESLRDSQTMLNRAQRLSGTGSVVRNLKTKATEWSDEMYRIFGVERETFVPRTEKFLELVHPEDRGMLADAIANGIQAVAEPSLEFRIVRPDGTLRWVYREADFWCDPDGTPAMRLTTYKDITEQRAADFHRRELEALLRDAIESISEGFVIYDANDRLVICNEGYRRIYSEIADLIVPGVHFADLLRAQLARGHRPELKGHEEEWIAEMLRKRRTSPEAHEAPMRDGRWILVAERPMSNGGLAGLRVDITAMKRVQQSLHESQERLDRTQRIAHIGTVERNVRTGEVVWSDETYRIFGVTRETYKPSFNALLALVHPDDHAALTRAFRRPDNEHANTSLKFRITRPSGETRILFSQADTSYQAGQPLYISIAMMDITEKEAANERRIELETQLRHSEKLTALGTLAGGIAHDLNNSLVPVQALSKLVMQELPPDAPSRLDLETIYQASIQARDLVRQILAFSRKQELLQEPTDITTRVKEALQMLRASVPSTIQLVERVAPVAPILADATQLQQVIVNLVTNGAHAIGNECGRVTVTLDEVPGEPGEPRMIRLSVADTGCGMSPEIMHRMFEPFFTTKSVGEGTGLGLSVVHGIVTSHGGTVDVKSTPGEGTEFIILLPARAADESNEIAAVA